MHNFLSIQVIILLVPFFLFGQEAKDESRNILGASFQKVNIGYGVQLDYGRKFGKTLRWQVNSGIYYHFNVLPRDDQGHAFHKRGWAEHWYNALGLNLSIQYDIVKYGDASLFGFYNIHILRTGFIDKFYQPMINPSTGNVFYSLHEGHIFEPSVTWENTIGLGVRCHLAEHIGFYIRGGLGISLQYNDYTFPSSEKEIFGTYTREGMTMLSSGVYYTF